MTTLTGVRVVLRPTTPGDVERLAEIVTTPEVAVWWPDFDLERVRLEMVDPDDAAPCVVEADGHVIGYIQYYEESDPEFRHAGIDVALDPAWHGRGLATDAVATLARHLTCDLGHHRVVIDPAADNEPAIRCYARVGFRRVGVMRRYWRDGDGQWRDGLLMDLLAEDLQLPS